MTGERRLRIGVAGLGRAFTVMLPTFAADPRVALVAAADPRAEARTRFAADFSAQTYDTVEALCADPAVEIVYVATPHQHHARTRSSRRARQARAGREADGADARGMRRDDRGRAGGGRALVVGHSHPSTRRSCARAQLIASGDFGAVRMINALNFTDFLYRPRRPEELDTARGGGAVFSQAAHQVDVVRLLGGGAVQERSRGDRRLGRGASDRGRVHGVPDVRRRRVRVAHLQRLRAFRLRRVVRLDRRAGTGQEPVCAPAARLASAEGEAAAKTARNYGGANDGPAASAACASAFRSSDRELRARRPAAAPNGVTIYRDGAARRSAAAARSAREVMDALCAALVGDMRADARRRVGTATLEGVSRSFSPHVRPAISCCPVRSRSGRREPA